MYYSSDVINISAGWIENRIRRSKSHLAQARRRAAGERVRYLSNGNQKPDTFELFPKINTGFFSWFSLNCAVIALICWLLLDPIALAYI